MHEHELNSGDSVIHVTSVPGQRLPDDQALAGGYADFEVLLDDPAGIPGLSFDGYAQALAGMIARSRAEFAVGIFGSWGSGKTTLMRAIDRELAADDNVVRAWFTAWRYEREPHLIVPLLDVLRETLEDQARQEGKSQWARTAAAAIGRAGRAFLAGLKISASVPGIDAEFEPGKMIDEIRNSGTEPAPLSFYHAGFVMLTDAIRVLSAGGRRRVVIFVDDLDRCLPARALDVLESMKLFFDVEGCIFVVGLDQPIVELGVATKFPQPPGSGETGPAAVTGTDYVKKIFQVHFALPSVSSSQLQAYLHAIERNSGFGARQLADFRNTVRPHLAMLQGPEPINPREVKRLINTYTLQLKILSLVSGHNPNPHVVLALLCMNFRPDWRELYNKLAAGPKLFQRTMQDSMQGGGWPDSVWLSGTKVLLPLGFVDYLRGVARPLLTVPNLASYVSAAESSLSTEPWVLDARTVVSRLRQVLDGFEITGDTGSYDRAMREFSGGVDHLARLIEGRRRPSGMLGVILSRVQSALFRLQLCTRELVDAERPAQATALLNEIDDALLEYSRHVSVS